jgi:hypothetical protein
MPFSAATANETENKEFKASSGVEPSITSMIKSSMKTP